jgi:hypothetical protein
MRYIIYLGILLSTFFAIAEVDQGLQNQLVKMAEQSRQVRQNSIKYTAENLPSTVQSLATQMSSLHTQTLKEIVRLHGWPDKKRVGIEGVQAALFLVQNSSSLAFQQDMLPFIIQAYINKDGVSGQQAATLTDIISIAQGKPQILGTQFDIVDGQVTFKPLANQATVDKLRAAMQLPPLADYKKQLENKHRD